MEVVEIELTAEVLARGVGATLAYGLLGSLLLALGWYALDLLTPGHLGELIYTERNRNAAILACAHIAALAIIVVVAVRSSDGGLFPGLIDVAVFGALGVALQAVGFKALDAVTPGHLGRIVTSTEPHPGVWVTAAFAVALGAVFAVALS